MGTDSRPVERNREVELSADLGPRDRPWVAPSPVRLVPGGQSVTLRVRQGEYVRGIVRDVRGDPVERACVFIFGLSATLTDAEGRFSLPMLPRRKARLRFLSPHDRRARPLEASVDDVLPEDSPIEVVLRPRR